ncbi:type II secretion system protein C [Luteimonas terricola]|uniref:Type II secretion system protein C n=1 Tax=Luteimonas terricola TaxID=645597 RepID=A0ABQ2EFY8_9GAMM|nr:type II secretion system protein C [Luteimonas terricola]
MLSERRDIPRHHSRPVPAFPTHRELLAVFAGPDGVDRLRRAAEVAIVILLAVQAARLAWLLLPPATLGAPTANTAAVLPAQPGRLAIDAFYPDRGTATTDTSGLLLFAVRPAAVGGSAIIAMREDPQRSFSVDEEVAPGVVLAEVRSDHVVLDSGGRRSELRFAKAGERPAPTRRAPAPAQTTSTPAPATDTPGPAVDPAQLLAQMGLRPEEADGRVTGYTVIPRGDGAVLRQAGLQAGDVLLSVNNEALDPERHADLGDILGKASTITLTYRRDGQIRSATLQAPTP